MQTEGGPTGFICRTSRAADAVSSVCEALGLTVGKDVDIFLCDYYLLRGQQPRYVYPRPVFTDEEQGKHMAKMLAAHNPGRSGPG